MAPSTLVPSVSTLHFERSGERTQVFIHFISKCITCVFIYIFTTLNVVSGSKSDAVSGEGKDDFLNNLFVEMLYGKNHKEIRKYS